MKIHSKEERLNFLKLQKIDFKKIGNYFRGICVYIINV